MNAKIATLLVLCLIFSSFACGCGGSETSPKPGLPDQVESPHTEEQHGAVSSLEELVLQYYNEYATLSFDQREKIKALWINNNFIFDNRFDLLTYYAQDLSKEAGIALLLWNGNCCVKYVVENYDGDDQYIEEVKSAYKDCLEKYYSLCTKKLSEEAFDDEFLVIIIDAYTRLMAACDFEIEKKGTSTIADLFEAYADRQGNEDVEEFFMFIDEGHG